MYNRCSMLTFCTNCGSQAQAGSRFCQSCGKELLPAVGRPVSPPTPPVYQTEVESIPQGRNDVMKWLSKPLQGFKNYDYARYAPAPSVSIDSDNAANDGTKEMDVHQASYEGNVEVVKSLLQQGVDPNCSHESNPNRISGPTPLNKICIAWTLTPAHIEIAKMLIRHGAVVDDSHFEDWKAEESLDEIWGQLKQILDDDYQPEQIE